MYITFIKGEEMLKDFRDGNKDVITMFRGTDKTHSFLLLGESGSRFIWDDYTVSCEGRTSVADEVPDFSFDVTHYEDADGVQFGQIVFPKEIMTGYIRENKIVWRVLAQDKVTNMVSVINYGDLLFKDM